MAIGKDKRRYMVSLTVSNVDRFQSLCKELGMSSRLLSEACDDAIRNISDVFQMQKDNGQLGVEDLFTVMGKQLQLALDGEKAKAVVTERKTKRKEVINANTRLSQQKRNSVHNGKNAH